jgi:hypothetical protein
MGAPEGPEPLFRLPVGPEPACAALEGPEPAFYRRPGAEPLSAAPEGVGLACTALEGPDPAYWAVPEGAGPASTFARLDLNEASNLTLYSADQSKSTFFVSSWSAFIMLLLCSPM